MDATDQEIKKAAADANDFFMEQIQTAINGVIERMRKVNAPPSVPMMMALSFLRASMQGTRMALGEYSREAGTLNEVEDMMPESPNYKLFCLLADSHGLTLNEAELCEVREATRFSVVNEFVFQVINSGKPFMTAYEEFKQAYE